MRLAQPSTFIIPERKSRDVRACWPTVARLSSRTLRSGKPAGNGLHLTIRLTLPNPSQEIGSRQVVALPTSRETTRRHRCTRCIALYSGDIVLF